MVVWWCGGVVVESESMGVGGKKINRGQMNTIPCFQKILEYFISE